MSATFTIRPACPTDAAELAALLRSIGWFDAFAQGDANQHTQRLAPLLTEHPYQRSTVACDPASGLLGYCALHWLPTVTQQGWDAYVSELFVAPQARGRSVGSQLLDHAVNQARVQGCARIWLLNNRERDSYIRGFYAQHGWQEQPQMARFVLTL